MVSEKYPSFVNRRPGSLNLWSPIVTGDWSQDVERGQLYAREAVSYMRTTGHIPFLHHVVKAMVGQGAWGGVEVGFIQIVAMEAVGAVNIERALAANHGYIASDEDMSVPAE